MKEGLPGRVRKIVTVEEEGVDMVVVSFCGHVHFSVCVAVNILIYYDFCQFCVKKSYSKKSFDVFFSNVLFSCYNLNNVCLLWILIAKVKYAQKNIGTNINFITVCCYFLLGFYTFHSDM